MNNILLFLFIFLLGGIFTLIIILFLLWKYLFKIEENSQGNLEQIREINKKYFEETHFNFFIKERELIEINVIIYIFIIYNRIYSNIRKFKKKIG